MTDDLAYFETEEFKQLLQQYEESVRSGHRTYMDADDLADIADYYHFEGRFSEADDAVNFALQLNPEAIGPLLYKSREAISHSDFSLAREFAERIRLQDNTEYLYLQGEILIAEGNTAEADQMFRKHFIEVSPDEHIDYVYDVANLFSEYNQFEKAFEWIARSQGDDSDDFKELMARTFFGLGKYKESEQLFDELIDHDPYSKKYWNALASAQFMNEDYDASITSSEYALAIDPDDAESLLSKANGLYRLENFEAALSYFEKYTEKVDFDEFGYLHQGTCLINMGRYEEAITRLEKAEEVSPADSQYLPEIFQELAFAYSELKKPESALYYIDKTTNLDCDHVDMEVIRGHILMANNRWKEAEKVFFQAMSSSSNPQKTMLRILVSLYDNRYVNAAYNLFKKYFNFVEHDWNEGYAYMALCCWDLHKDQEFMDYLKIAVEKNPRETKLVLGNLFPKGLQPGDYYDYMYQRLKKD